MTWFPINIKLIILIVDKKTSPFLINSKMCIIPLREQIYIITVGYLSFYFYRLSQYFWSGIKNKTYLQFNLQKE